MIMHYQEGLADGAEMAAEDLQAGLGWPQFGLVESRDEVFSASERRRGMVAYREQFPHRYRAACSELAYRLGVARAYREAVR